MHLYRKKNLLNKPKKWENNLISRTEAAVALKSTYLQDECHCQLPFQEFIKLLK